MTQENSRVWFITGNSKFFSRLLREQLLAKGEKVVETDNKPEELKDLISEYPKAAIALPIDVTDSQQVKDALNRVLDTFGLLNNLGYGLINTLEEPTNERWVRRIDFQMF
ncbi:MAG: SDR family NAD(P)-dependent oxidoreductase [Prochloraceae cyanobacterium]